jgi:hypothetical protein
MFLTVHAASGVLIGEYIPNSILAFLAGFVSHFLLDIVPHGDQGLLEGVKKGGKIRKALALTTIDNTVLIIFISLLYNNKICIFHSSASWALIGSILPDFIIGLNLLTKNKIVQSFFDFHKSLHYVLGIKINLISGIIIQILTFLLILKSY